MAQSMMRTGECERTTTLIGWVAFVRTCIACSVRTRSQGVRTMKTGEAFAPVRSAFASLPKKTGIRTGVRT